MSYERISLLDDDNNASSLKPPSMKKNVITIDDHDNDVMKYSTPAFYGKNLCGDSQENSISVDEIDASLAVASMPFHKRNTVAPTQKKVIDLLEEKDDDDCILLIAPSPERSKKNNISTLQQKVKPLDSKIHPQPDLKPKATIKSVKMTFSEILQQRTQELFPDMDESFMKENVLKQYDESYKQFLMKKNPIYTEEDCIVTILQLIVSSAEANNYPKTQRKRGHHTITHAAAQVMPTCLYDYNNPSSNILLSETYRKECTYNLQRDFPFINYSGIKQILIQCQSRYTLGFNYIRRKLQATINPVARNAQNSEDSEDSEEMLHLLENAMAGKRLNPLSLHAFPKNFILKKPRKSDGSRIHVTDPILYDEVRYARYKLEEWKLKVQKKINRKKARRISEENGNTLECQCCFADVAFEEMVSCQDEGHLFCVDCIQRYAEEQVFGGNYNSAAGPSFLLTCMHGDGCKSQFSYEQLKNALSPKVLAKLNELETTLAIEKAGASDDLCKCPKCDFQALLPCTETIFRCPVASCGYESCRKCGEPPHIPLKCEEVEKQNETDGRKFVEEAMTKALIRTCPRPKCKSKFLKESGCNKMTCKCGAWVCYVCQQEVTRHVGYKHFCQVPHCSHQKCNKCPLYDKPEQKRDEMNSVRKAGLKAAEEVRKRSEVGMSDNSMIGGHTSQRNLKNSKKEVIVNVDSILQTPPKSISRKRVRF